MVATATGSWAGGGKFTIAKTGVAHYFTIDTNGNVGLSQTSPAEKLDVNGNAKISGHIKISGTPGTNYIEFPDGSKQYTACGILFSPSGRTGRTDGGTPAGSGSGATLSECSAAASLQQVVQEQRVQLQRLQAEIDSLKQKLEALVGGRQ